MRISDWSSDVCSSDLAEQYFEIESERPVLDVEEVALDAALDLLQGIGLATPAVHLRPARDAGLHPVAGGIGVDGLFVQPPGGLGRGSVRTRADQRHVALENVAELRQLVESRQIGRASCRDRECP